MSRLLFASILLAAATAAAQEAPSVSVLVPVVGSTVGSDAVRWKTDLELRNDMKTEATVALSLPAAPDQPVIILTIPPGGLQRFGDVVGEAFGLDNVLSPLVVQTLGRRSIRVNATAYGIQGTEVTKPQPIPLMDPSAFYPLRTLSSLAWSDTFRTNIGLVNLGEREAVFTMALRIGGQTAAASRVVLAPNSMWHMALQLLFPAIEKGDEYTLLVETGTRDTFVYASVVTNSTNEARFVVPAAGAR